MTASARAIAMSGGVLVRLGRVICWALALGTWSAATRAEPVRAELEDGRESARVIIWTPASADPVIREALILTGGELAAVGLQVDVRSYRDDELRADSEILKPLAGTEDDVFGKLVFARSGSQLTVYAFAPGLDAPITQVEGVAGSGPDPEIVAVRAVEVLRAAMLQYARQPRANDDALPSTVTGFTQAAPSPAESKKPERAAPLSTSPAANERTDSDADEPHAGVERRWQLWAGPMLWVDVEPRLVGVGPRLTLLATHDAYGAGLTLDAGWSMNEVRGSEGVARVRRLSALAQFQAHLWWSQRAFGFARAAIGVAHYRVAAEAAPGFVAQTGEHLSPSIAIELGTGYWLSDWLGAYVSTGSTLAIDPAQVRFAGREVAIIDRPALVSSLGLMLRL